MFVGINLQIRNLNIDDAGNYICEVENDAEPIQQLNQLQILGKIIIGPNLNMHLLIIFYVIFIVNLYI